MHNPGLYCMTSDMLGWTDPGTLQADQARCRPVQVHRADGWARLHHTSRAACRISGTDTAVSVESAGLIL